MLRFSLFLLFCIPLFAQSNVTRSQQQLHLDKQKERVFQNAVRDFRYGSYYRALDELSYLAKFPHSAYYLQALFMLSKTYLAIGKRLGSKKYLWSALNYLNLYLSKGGRKSSEYYYLKANIYENLGFYERAFSNYKMALKRSFSKHQTLKILMGMLRTAVWLERMDLATRYMLMLSIETLEKNQKKEFIFLQGMYHFVRGDYAKALAFFKKTYKEFESYLIDNPSYYYYVAESAYRYGDLKFTELLFRRILNYIKNKEVIQKTLLRLGDIKFLQHDYKSSINYYMRLIKNFPKAERAKVAKLKLLFIMHRDPKSAYYIKSYFPKEEFVQNPLKFIVKTLVQYRNSYLGLFALANFGLEALKIDSKKLYKRLGWELSLVSPKQLKYEHKEYFARLWKEYIDAKRSGAICELYSANPAFFIEVFDDKTLLKIASFLHGCKKELLRIALLEKVMKRSGSKQVRYALLEALYENKMFDRALKILRRDLQESCKEYTLYAKICFMAQKKCPGVYERVVSLCPRNDLYRNIFANIILLRKERGDISFLRNNGDILAKMYKKDEVVRRFVQLFAKKLLDKERYRDVIELLTPLTKQIEKDCFLNGILSLSYIRVGKIEYAKNVLQSVKDCNTTWYRLAKVALENIDLETEVEE